MSIELVDYVLISEVNKKGPKYFGPFSILLLTLSACYGSARLT
jgi:hypothetical protein